jgi:hypothetical protein
VLVWNNTAIDNCTDTDPYLANVSVVDDSRCVTGDVLPDGRPCTGTAGTLPVAADVNDRCEPSSRGGNANTCNAQGIVLMNNLISGSGSARPLLNVEDPNPTAYGAALIVQASDYQAYFRSSGNAPSNLIEWQLTAGSAAIGYRNLKAFRDVVTNLEVHSVDLVRGSGNPYFDDLAGGSYEQNRDNPDVWGNGAPLPADVLAAVNYPRVSPAQPFPRIGAISWYGSDAIKPDDGGGVFRRGCGRGGGRLDRRQRWRRDRRRRKRRHDLRIGSQRRHGIAGRRRRSDRRSGRFHRPRRPGFGRRLRLPYRRCRRHGQRRSLRLRDGCRPGVFPPSSV